jgi:uncharacterized protein
MILAPIVHSFIPENDLLYSFYALSLYLLQSLISLYILYLFTIRKYKVKIKDFGFRKINLLKSLKFVLLMWFLILILLSGLVETLRLFFGDNIPGFAKQIDHIPLFGNNLFGYISLFLSAFIIAPIVEEIIFRGFILQGLIKYLSPLSSVLITSLIFALLHFEFASIIPLFIIGSMLGFIYLRKKSIWDCLIYHAINNGFALIFEFILLLN